jgi:hypothetical protein
MSKKLFNFFVFLIISGLLSFNSVVEATQPSLDEDNSAVKRAAVNCLRSARPQPPAQLGPDGNQACKEFDRLQKPLKKKCANGEENACKQLKEITNTLGSALFEEDVFTAKNTDSLTQEQKIDIAKCAKSRLTPKPNQDPESEIKRSCRKLNKLIMDTQKKCTRGDATACSFATKIMKEQATQIGNLKAYQ